MVPVLLRELPRGLGHLERRLAHAVLARVQLDHEEEREVVEHRRDRRHLDDLEVRDLQVLGDDERGGSQHRRREDRAQASGGEQPARGVLSVARFLEHRPRHRANRYRGCDTGARRAAQQERGKDHGAPRARRLAAEEGERKIEEEPARPRVLQERAVDGEEDDQCRGHVDRGAEDALERHEHVADQPRDVVAAVRPWRGQVRAGEGVGDEAADDHRHDPARGAPRGLDHERDHRHAEHHVEARGPGVAVGEAVAALDHVDDCGDGHQREDHVPPHEAVAVALGDREQHVRQEQHDADVDVAQVVGAYDRVGGVEVEGGARDRNGDEEAGEPAAVAVEAPLLLLDELLDLLELLLRELRGHWIRRARAVPRAARCRRCRRRPARSSASARPWPYARRRSAPRRGAASRPRGA